MRPACPQLPAFTYLDPAQLAADKVDISILARDPRSISTSAPEMAKSAGLMWSPVRTASGEGEHFL